MSLLAISMVCSARSLVTLGTKKCEGIVVNVMFRTCDIPSTNVLLYLDGVNIAFVASCNHPPKVWIMHALSFEWPQCDYPLARGIICKHAIKIYKTLHPTIPDGVIV
jgi:hypothetical protein